MPEILDSRQALIRMERRICQALVIQGVAGDERSEPPGEGVTVLSAGSPSGAVASATGTALAGLRSAAFVEGQLDQASSALKSAARQHIPLLVHAALRQAASGSHSAYHALADSGLFLLLPHTAQQVLDFTLLAHWLCEQALVPGLVACDQHSAASLEIPSHDLMRDFLGQLDEEIESPSAAQALIFGEWRKRRVGWFDLDRPMALAGLRSADEEAAAAAGEEFFFRQHLPQMALEGMQQLSRRTGRPLSWLTHYRTEDARYLLLAQGAAFETLKAVVHQLRRDKKWKIGALGVTWLRPFPLKELRQTLSGKKAVAVIECSQSPFGSMPPLMQELRSHLNGEVGRWVSARFGGGQLLEAGQVAELAAELTGRSPRAQLWLGVEGKFQRRDFPKRQSLLEATANDYPALQSVTASRKLLEEPKPGAFRLLCLGTASTMPKTALRQLVEAASQNGSSFAQGILHLPEPGLTAIRVQASPEAVPMPESGVALDMLMAEGRTLQLCPSNPLAELRPQGRLVVAFEGSGQELWQRIPDSWKSEIRRLDLSLHRIDAGFEALLQAALDALSGREPSAPEGWKEWPQTALDSERIPALVRRFADIGPACQNLPRFWGEAAQPQRQGFADRVPEPLTALGTVPAASAALTRPDDIWASALPRLEAEKCTGCGICWTACPDSAIGASVLEIRELLDQAVASSGAAPPLASALQRTHKAVASQLSKALSEKGVAAWRAENLEAAYQQAVGKVRIPEDQASELEQLIRQVSQQSVQISPVVCELFFDRPRQSGKEGGLLFLATDPSACTGCQICIQSCPEDAWQAEKRDGPAVAQARQQWTFWEALPDTSGARVAQALEDPDLGRLSALMLSRHCSQAQLGTGLGETGSGARLATRLAVGMAEYEGQQQLQTRLSRCRELTASLQKSLKEVLSQGLAEEDPEILERALEDISGSRPSLAELDQRLTELGQGVRIDRSRLHRLAHSERELKEEARRLREGSGGLGRSRFGLLVASRPGSSSDRSGLAAWAARFPAHPFAAPLTACLDSSAAALALGLCTALSRQAVDQVRLLRRAALCIQAPSDLPARLKKLEELHWQALDEEERSACPPLLVLAEAEALSAQDLESVAGLLSSDLPIKLILLGGELQSGFDPLLLALAVPSPTPFILSSSIAYPQHLAEGWRMALRHPGPALIHLDAPSPSGHGFDASETLERARLGVEARLHPLFRSDPAAAGVLGLRLSLQGNPAAGSDWGEVDLVEWALGESRFADQFSPLEDGANASPLRDYLQLTLAERSRRVPFAERSGKRLQVASPLIRLAERRLQLWKIYKEMAGLENPFTERLRQQAEKEALARQQESFESLKQESEQRIAGIEQDLDQRMAALLRQRLRTLAGLNR